MAGLQKKARMKDSLLKTVSIHASLRQEPPLWGGEFPHGRWETGGLKLLTVITFHRFCGILFCSRTCVLGSSYLPGNAD